VKERLAWGPLIEGYLVGRAPLRGVVLIVDARRGVEAEEEQLLGFLRHHQIPAALVATKIDKLGRAAAGKALAKIGAALGPDVPVVPFSARSGEGRDALWRIIRGWLGSPGSR
jgi:GTP-binding protein